MKRTFSLIAAAVSLILSGCGKNEITQVSINIESYTKELIRDGAVSVRHQTVPKFDADGRITSITIESCLFSAEGDTTSYSKGTSTYVYAEPFHAAVDVSVLEGDLAFFDKPTVEELTFDDGWKLTSAYFGMLESTDSFEYDGDRMIRHTNKGLSHETVYDITWKDGDIVGIKDDSATITITYLEEENPFKIGLDLVLENLLPDYCTLGMTGARTAHLPASYTNASTKVTTYNYEYKKDAYGRIAQIAVKGEAKDSYSVISIHY